MCRRSYTRTHVVHEDETQTLQYRTPMYVGGTGSRGMVRASERPAGEGFKYLNVNRKAGRVTRTRRTIKDIRKRVESETDVNKTKLKTKKNTHQK